MTRTVVTISRRTLERLKTRAAARKVSMATLIREALDEKAEEDQPAPTFIGIFDSGTGDLARRSTEERPEPRSWR